MYKTIFSLTWKSTLFPQSIFKSSQNISQYYIGVAEFVTTTNKNANIELEDTDTSHDRFTPKASAKDLIDNSATFIDQTPLNEESKWSTSPYPEGSIPRSQAHYSLRPKINPKETSIILFPGEGNQYVGMGKHLLKFPTCRDLFEVANDILKFDLIKLCLQGPKTELDKTSNAQVSVLVNSLAAVERLKEERPSGVENCIATAGFGIGELTALVFAGVLSFERAVRLAQLRGEAMQMASEMVPGGMMTIMYRPDTKLGNVILKAKESAMAVGVQAPQCSVAYYLFPHCKVIAGHNECLDFIEENKDEFNITQVRRLPVAGAFHTNLMHPAAEPFKQALRKSNLNEPLIAVHSNCDGKRYRDVYHIVNQLPKQIYKPVKWEQILHVLYERKSGDYFPHSFECGPGDSLKKLLKMVNSKAWSSCVSDFI